MTADIEQWRGVAADTDEEMPSSISVILRRRTRALLSSLLRPHRRSMITVSVAIVVGTAASMAIPALVGIGIDSGISHAADGDHTTIIAVTRRDRRLRDHPGAADPGLPARAPGGSARTR